MCPCQPDRRLSCLAAAMIAMLAVEILAGAAARADEIVLANGDRLSGRVLARAGERVIFEHDVLGRLELAAADLRTPRQDPDPEPAPAPHVAPAARAGAAPAAVQDEAPAPADGPTEPEWKSKFILGGAGTFGNTDTQSLNVTVTSVREREVTRLALDGSYYYGASDGDRTDNRFTAGVLHDWLVPDSPWLYFAKGRYDFDEFQSWDYRVSAHGGVGYELIAEEDFDLTLRAGLGVIKEFNSDNDGFRPEALLGFDLRWQISERQELAAGSTIYPDLEETGDFRTVSYVSWSLLADPETNMSLTAGLEHEYQSQVDPGVERNDLRVRAGLQFDF